MLDEWQKPFAPKETRQWPAFAEILKFDAKQIMKLKPLVSDIFNVGNRVLVAGPSKSCKTWLLLDLALCLSSGSEWLGFQCNRAARCYYVNFELSEYYMQQRLRAIRKVKDLALSPDVLYLWNLRDFDFTFGEFIDELTRRCKELKPDVVFIDPFYRLLGELDDAQSHTQMAGILKRFDPIREAGTTLVFAMHSQKGDLLRKDPQECISGPWTFSADADALIVVRRKEGQSFRLDFILRDHAPIDPIAVEWKYPLLVECQNANDTGAKLGRPKSDANLKMIMALEKADYEGGLTATEWQKTSGVARATFFRTIADLIQQKIIFISTDGLYQLSPVYVDSQKIARNGQNQG